ncbi:MAG: type II secretion system protein [Massilia sp.]|nr:type II secretion system protein [Massilia sp.]
MLELVIVTAVMALLAGVLLNRVVWYQRQAELAGVQQLVGALRSALRLQASALLTRDGGEPALAALAAQNPMTWLVRTPGNYLGEYYSPVIDALPRGAWFYDKNNKTLIYLLIDGKNVTDGVNDVMKFKVKLFPATSEPGKHMAPTALDRIVLEQVTG